MMATNNSRAAGPAALLAVIGVCLAAGAADEIKSKFARRAEQKYLEARKQVRSKTNDVETTWQFGRACFDWAEFSRDDDQREQLANEGISACRQVVAKVPKSAAGHYYLAMNLGQLARTKTFGALKLVPEMEKEFKAARELDEKFDYAGPDRNLGSLYLDAPGWPASIGSKSKARRHLQRAVEIAGHYPDNRLRLLEAYLGWGEAVDLERERKALAELWEKAKKEFPGEAWEESWLNWERRWKTIREKAGK
jgi:tetratricopeptide (TPR) repeat protein